MSRTTQHTVRTIPDFADALTVVLKGQPVGTVGVLPMGDWVWISPRDPEAIEGCDPKEQDTVYEWDASALDEEVLAEINEWLKAPALFHASGLHHIKHHKY